MMISIPANFAHFIIELHGESGRAWLGRLPTILATYEQRWHLTLGVPFTNLSFHYVIPAVRDDGIAVVVKAQSPTGEFTKETEALRLFDGHGTVRLLAYDMNDEVMLLERLHPGTPLRKMADDVKAISIATTVMKQMWRPVPREHPFSTVEKWGEGFHRLREYYEGGNGPFPKALLEEAETLYAELSASMAEPKLLHGDLHQDNILESERNEWRAIDPKGLVGEAAYETGALLRNFLPDLLKLPNPKQTLARRVKQLAEELDIEHARVRGWGLAQAVLAAWWGVEDNGQLGEDTLTCARLLSELKV
ncbi:MAG: aminoglycoside phosphotransferase family protein [Ktedonobacteraceae bacterium]